MATLPPPVPGAAVATPEVAAGLAGGSILPLGAVAIAVGPSFATAVENLWQQHITNVESAEFKTLIQGFPSVADFSNSAELRELATKYPELRNIADDAGFMKAGHELSTDFQSNNLDRWNHLPPEVQQRVLKYSADQARAQNPTVVRAEATDGADGHPDEHPDEHARPAAPPPVRPVEMTEQKLARERAAKQAEVEAAELDARLAQARNQQHKHETEMRERQEGDARGGNQPDPNEPPDRQPPGRETPVRRTGAERRADKLQDRQTRLNLRKVNKELRETRHPLHNFAVGTAKYVGIPVGVMGAGAIGLMVWNRESGGYASYEASKVPDITALRNMKPEMIAQQWRQDIEVSQNYSSAFKDQGGHVFAIVHRDDGKYSICQVKVGRDGKLTGDPDVEHPLFIGDDRTIDETAKEVLASKRFLSDVVDRPRDANVQREIAAFKTKIGDNETQHSELTPTAVPGRRTQDSKQLALATPLPGTEAGKGSHISITKSTLGTGMG